jgi:hypothetical protein
MLARSAATSEAGVEMAGDVSAHESLLGSCDIWRKELVMMS